MIIDTLDNLEKYVSLNPLFREVIDFMKANKWKEIEDGKHLLKGDDVFVNVQTLKGKLPAEAAMEYHRKMIDVQVPISSPETYGYIPMVELPADVYNEENDMGMIPGVTSQTFVTVKPGQFVIFMPQDGHAPGISDQPQFRKAIFKVKA
ncbi:YhcH/YjgK/YiaL family protein [Bacteroidales bacterium KA00344]|nr:YhcH/YjgK/YiaL family protein [Bacteroidales bacterium KA00344]